jgi:spore germination cell wall hydrolase CwlJ-like protein
MIALRRSILVSAGVAAALGVVILPASMSLAAERTPMLSYDFTGFSAPAPLEAPPAANSENSLQTGSAETDQASITCLAKVVHHEARNQPRSGQLAVAQTLVNRLKAGGRFGSTICEVANQPGQYFNTSAYRPRGDESWDEAVEIARDTLNGEADQVAPGAIFFRAAYSPSNNFFRRRQRVAAVGDHVFYR